MPEATQEARSSIATPPGDTPAREAETLPVSSQWKLIRRRFLRHRLAAVAAVVVASLYLVVIFADFLASSDPTATNAQRALAPPQHVHYRRDGRFAPFVYGLQRKRNPDTLVVEYLPDESIKVPVTLFAHGYPYRLFGLIPTDIHLIGTAAGAQMEVHWLGTDHLGRDLYSRIVVAIRTSLTIGLVAVFLSLLLGVTLGGISGYYGGRWDLAIQRLIEILRAVPTIPLWMGLAVAIPNSWGVTAVYFAITIIISLIGWTELAREVRTRIMALRREDFVLAAELCGARPRRIIFVHLVPLCTSHIIAATTLALPAMIASETALSFLGLGLRPPVISLGVLLNGAQSIQSIALYPWILSPIVPTAMAILAFNFVGEGLRDAADPYD
jgi:peptide/nickel transport system permease protein